ncbi:unnamed protein product [Didymodactylos carnosus]|uniref:Uncharacterized protein n=1 Tax=Didymodactylos carnosus TaxID=1234261 RepID=A0A815V4K7_9BILA|nr:unnamed protein product [Didymodactylos carnosus]CAF1525824.1 unnamed protein product [Didymodactylos carnosus]CAF3856541.1 unnamed protein product [Didymodactylos carnosus]CAF4384765.1 unnamed protein product [Didymodactylos carnosus]
MDASRHLLVTGAQPVPVTDGMPCAPKTHLNQESPSKSLQSIENNPPINDFNTVVRINSQQSIGVNTDHNPSKHDCSTNTPDYVDDLINNGLHMTEEEFKSFKLTSEHDSGIEVNGDETPATMNRTKSE